MIVLDASAAVDLLLRTEVGQPIAEEILDPGESLHAPDLIYVEVAQALRRLCRSADLSTSRAEEALADLAALPVHPYGGDLLLSRAWELRENLAIYDAVYVALAELLDCPLLTRDARVAGAAGHGATVRLL